MCSSIYIAERKCLSLAQTESGGQTDAVNNGSTNAKTETRNQQQPLSNGVPDSPLPPTFKIPQTVNSAAAASNNDPHSRTSFHSENENMKTKSGKAF